MPVLTASGVRRAYGDRVVLDGVALGIDEGERVGLVGPNGAGKSTLARILAGAEPPDVGEVVPRRDARIAYLPQEPVFEGDPTAREAVVAALGPWSEAWRRHAEATRALAEGRGALDAALAAQETAAADLERLGGWDRMFEVEAVLGHLGVREPDAPVARMSGGERRRVDLARILVAAPDLAILDEPTNHLDADTIEWLEAHLAEAFPGALLLVTHDRYVLDRVATRTLELDRAALHSYPGGWDAFLEAKAERLAHEARAEANRRNFVARELEWLRRQPKARTGKQKARIDRAEAAVAARPTAQRTVGDLTMGTAEAGRTVLELHDLALEVGGRRLVEGLELRVGRGDRVGIVGPNGAGKTSLFRAILGELEPAAGRIVRGARTRFAYLEQTRAALDPDSTVFDAVSGGASRVDVAGRTVDTHAWLERFLLAGARAREKVGHLSGGERARVALARLLLSPANVLLLDEPTNDLDVDTLAALESLLVEVDASVLVVTHDRYFLDRVATRTLVFEGDGRVVPYAGGWSDSRAQRAAAARPAAPPSAATAPEPARAPRRPTGLTYAERLELERIVSDVEAADAEVARLEAALADPATYADGAPTVPTLLAALDTARAEATRLLTRWETLETKKAATDPASGTQ